MYLVMRRFSKRCPLFVEITGSSGVCPDSEHLDVLAVRVLLGNAHALFEEVRVDCDTVLLGKDHL